MTNPWSEAAEEAAATATPRYSEPRQQQLATEQSSCLYSFLELLVKLWHVLDALVGLAILIYGCTLLSSHLVIPIVLTLGLGSLLMLRAMLGLASGKYEAFDRCGLRWSSVYLSPLLALFNVILSILCMGNNHAILVNYIQKHASQLHLSDTETSVVVSFLQTHHHALWILFLVQALMEVIRWWTIPIFHSWLLQRDNHHLLLDSTNTGSISALDCYDDDVQLLYTPNRKPWWWKQSPESRSHSRSHGQGRRRRRRRTAAGGRSRTKNNNNMSEPLLLNDSYNEEAHDWTRHNHDNSRHYSIHDGMSPRNEAGSSFWSRWFGSPQQKDKNDDDDDDFASVQEEWASKSEEDPFWWSREQQQQQQTQTETQASNTTVSPLRDDHQSSFLGETTQAVNDTSWATEHAENHE